MVFSGKCFILFLVLKLSDGVYLTGSINTTQFHTDYWYHVGDQIHLVCCAPVRSQYLIERIWWILKDKNGVQQSDFNTSSTINQQNGIILSTHMLMTLKWKHDMFLLNCQYGKAKNGQLINEETLMRVRFHLKTTSNSEHSSFQTNHAATSGKEHSSFQTNHAATSGKEHSSFQTNHAATSGKEHSSFQTNHAATSGKEHSSFQTNHAATSGKGAATSTSVHAVVSSEKTLLEEIDDNQNIYVAAGSMCAILLLSCIIVYFLWRQLHQRKDMHYAILDLEQRPPKTFPPQEPYAEVIIDNENYNSNYVNTVNDKTIFSNTSELCYAEINPYAQTCLETMADQKRIYDKPIKDDANNAGPQSLEDAFKIEISKNKVIENNYVNLSLKNRGNTLLNENQLNSISNIEFCAESTPHIMKNKNQDVKKSINNNQPQKVEFDNGGYCNVSLNRSKDDNIESLS